VKPSWRFALLAYLLVEVALTLSVAAWLGAGRTVLALILAGVGGIAVLRRERLAIFTQLRNDFTIGMPFLAGLPDRVLRAMAGLLLISPGFVSDALALLLLVPTSRRWLVRHLSATLSSGHPAAGPTIIEGDFCRVEDAALPDQRADMITSSRARTDPAER
jgi:UPF0716 protein FxsA